MLSYIYYAKCTHTWTLIHMYHLVSLLSVNGTAQALFHYVINVVWMTKLLQMCREIQQLIRCLLEKYKWFILGTEPESSSVDVNHTSETHTNLIDVQEMLDLVSNLFHIQKAQLTNKVTNLLVVPTLDVHHLCHLCSMLTL